MAKLKGLIKDFDITTDVNSIDIEIETVDNSEIAIIGISGRFSMAEDIDRFWENLDRGIDCIRHLPDSRKKDYYRGDMTFQDENNKKAYLDDIDKFDYEYFSLTPIEANLMDPNQRLLLEDTVQALENAGYGGNSLDGENIGVFVGFSNDLTEEYKHHCMENYTEDLNKALAGNLKSVIPSRISYFLNLKGPSVLIDTACSSSLVAVHMACQSLKNQECDMAIVGSVELHMFQEPSCNINLGIKSSDGKAKTFDNRSDGTGIGEGVITIVLKPLNKAKRDKDFIHAVIKGSAVNQDGSTIGITAPNPAAQSEVIEKAWKNAKANPESITYIEAHGTGTKLGDPIEINGLTNAFKKYTNKKQICGVGSVKTNIGHLGGAAGLAGLTKLVLSLKNKKIPPSLHFKTPNKKITFINSPLYINNKSLDWESNYPRRGGVSSFGLSGTNCHIVLEEAPNDTIDNTNTNTKDQYHTNLFCISAKDVNSLKLLILKYIEFFRTNTEINIGDVCYTVSTGRGHYNHRLAIIVDSAVDLLSKLEKFLNNDMSAIVNDNIFYSYHKIVSIDKNNKSSNELYEHDKTLLSTNAGEVIIEMLNNNEMNEINRLRDISKLYIAGADICWKNLYKKGSYYRQALPYYQFKKERCWLEVKNKTKNDNNIEDNVITNCGYSSMEIKQENNNNENLFEKVVEILVGIIHQSTGLKTENIDIFMNFFEMGLDSILILSVINSVKSNFQIEIPASKFYGELTTINSLAKYIFDNIDPQTFENIKGEDENKVENKIAEVQYINPDMKVSSSDDFMEKIIKEQIEIMKKQLELLSNRNIDVANHKEVKLKENNYVKSKIHKDQTSRSVMPFGQISVVDNNLQHEKKVKLNNFISEYNRRTQKSKKYAGENRYTLANNRNTAGFRPNLKELIYPIVSKEAFGSKLIDLDNNEYIDLTMGFGVYLFGNNPKFINEELESVLKNNMNIGPMSSLAYEAAKLISQLTGVERVAFSNTGTEANMMAVRLARSATKRNKIVIFEGSYHGNYDGVLARPHIEDEALGTLPIAPGITDSSVSDTVVLEYGAKESLEYIQLYAEEIAAVLIEPVQSRRPELQPKEFLKKLRAITLENKIIMIFDEIITGFRILPGGAQQWFEVEADLVTYGKVIGGGMPIGVIAGKAEFMDGIDGGYWSYADNSYPNNIDKKTAFAGTFCQHPFAMSAVISVAKRLLNEGKQLQLSLNEKTEEIANRLNEFFLNKSIDIEVVHFGSLFRFKSSMDLDLFFYSLINSGIYVWEGRNCFLSTEHSLEDIEKIIQVVKNTTDTLIQQGFWKSTGVNTNDNELSHIKDLDQSNDSSKQYRALKEVDYYPLSYSQENIYILEKLKNVGLSYHMPALKRVKGELDINKVEDVFKKLINRHEALRTSFHMKEGVPVQKIHQEVKFNVSIFTGIEDDYDNIIDNFYKPFDLDKPPLIRVGLIRLNSTDHILMIDMHHIISDGQSTNILFKEFYQLYHGVKLPPITLQFKEYVQMQRELMDKKELKNSKMYWLNLFKNNVVNLDLPLDYNRPSEQSFKSNHIQFTFDADLTHSLQMVAKSKAITLYMLLLGIYTITLSKYTGKEDIVVGIPVLGRNEMSVMNTIGMFVNTLPIRNYPNKELTVSEFLINVKEQLQLALIHQDYPFSHLVKELDLNSTNDKNPLFDTMFIMDNQEIRQETFSGLEVTDLKKVEMGSKVDIQLEILFDGKELRVTLIYCSELFKEETIKKFVERFKKITCEIVSDPTKIIKNIESESEVKNSLLEMFNEDIL